MTDFTLEQAKAAWQEVLKERGPLYVYGGACYYSPQEGSGSSYGCAVGGIVHKLAPEVFKAWTDWEELNAQSFVIGGWKYANESVPQVDIDAETLRFLGELQGMQDTFTRYDVIDQELADFPFPGAE